ncbi:hypothetical protein MFIFM68171_05840 [Madurella fahalii]|uniref:Thioredoxin-like fold domain-containing protein n=1 Tax=Madurella fahalii TaxID=1157608 RepID=A0ABQ0GDL0_9PEZI
MATPTKSPPRFTIYRGFHPAPAHVWSPFANKLEARFRLAGVPYRLDAGSPRHAPRGKIPYIRIEGSDELMGDTALITHKLIDDGILADLNAGLTPAERAQDMAVRAVLEDKLYFYGMRERWVDNYYAMRDGVLAALPFPVRFIVGNLAHRAAVNTLHGQGTGRYSAEELRWFQREAWGDLDALLAESRARNAAAASDKPFWLLGRAEPSEADAALYGFITSSLVCSAAPETQKMVRGLPALMDYAKRIHAAYFSDYDIWEDEV